MTRAMPTARRTRCRCNSAAPTAARRGRVRRRRCVTCRRSPPSASTITTTTATTASMPARPAATCGTAVPIRRTRRPGCRCCRRPRWRTPRSKRWRTSCARAAYADELRAAFGDDLFQDHAAAFRAAGLALEVFQQSPADFYPFTSKFDGVLRGQQKLDAAEARGLKLFNAPDKGNCAACHISERTPDGAFSAVHRLRHDRHRRAAPSRLGGQRGS